VTQAVVTSDDDSSGAGDGGGPPRHCSNATRTARAAASAAGKALVEVPPPTGRCSRRLSFPGWRGRIRGSSVNGSPAIRCCRRNRSTSRNSDAGCSGSAARIALRRPWRLDTAALGWVVRPSRRAMSPPAGAADRCAAGARWPRSPPAPADPAHHRRRLGRRPPPPPADQQLWHAQQPPDRHPCRTGGTPCSSRTGRRSGRMASSRHRRGTRTRRCQREAATALRRVGEGCHPVAGCPRGVTVVVVDLIPSPRGRRCWTVRSVAQPRQRPPCGGYAVVRHGPLAQVRAWMRTCADPGG